MPDTTADKIIGKTLYANKKLVKLNGALQPIGYFNAGDMVGVVYSYIQREGIVYWMFKQPYTNNFYYVKHTSDSFKFTGDVKQATDITKVQREKEIIEAKGKVPYYIEKYGKYLLIGILAITAINAYIKKQ